MAGFGYRPTGFQAGQQRSSAERDIGDMLIAGFALAAGAGIFHAVVWGVKQLAKKSVKAEGVIPEA